MWCEAHEVAGFMFGVAWKFSIHTCNHVWAPHRSLIILLSTVFSRARCWTRSWLHASKLDACRCTSKRSSTLSKGRETIIDENRSGSDRRVEGYSETKQPHTKYAYIKHIVLWRVQLWKANRLHSLTWCSVTKKLKLPKCKIWHHPEYSVEKYTYWIFKINYSGYGDSLRNWNPRSECPRGWNLRFKVFFYVSNG